MGGHAHRCHATPPPTFGHSFACPTREHPDGWMHTNGGPHAGTCPAVEGQKCGPLPDPGALLLHPDRIPHEQQRGSLDATLNRLISAELEAGNDERAAALRCLRAWNRGAGYVIQRRIV